MKKMIFVTLTPDWTWPEDFLTCWFPEQTWNEDQEMSEEKLDRFSSQVLYLDARVKVEHNTHFMGSFRVIFVSIFD